MKMESFLNGVQSVQKCIVITWLAQERLRESSERNITLYSDLQEFSTFVSFEGEIHREFFLKPGGFSAGPVVCVADCLSHRSDHYQ